jgi:hypothetical protein
MPISCVSKTTGRSDGADDGKKAGQRACLEEENDR